MSNNIIKIEDDFYKDNRKKKKKKNSTNPKNKSNWNYLGDAAKWVVSGVAKMWPELEQLTESAWNWTIDKVWNLVNSDYKNSKFKKVKDKLLHDRWKDIDTYKKNVDYYTPAEKSETVKEAASYIPSIIWWVSSAWKIWPKIAASSLGKKYLNSKAKRFAAWTVIDATAWWLVDASKAKEWERQKAFKSWTLAWAIFPVAFKWLSKLAKPWSKINKFLNDLANPVSLNEKTLKWAKSEIIKSDLPNSDKIKYTKKIEDLQYKNTKKTFNDDDYLTFIHATNKKWVKWILKDWKINWSNNTLNNKLAAEFEAQDMWQWISTTKPNDSWPWEYKAHIKIPKKDIDSWKIKITQWWLWQEKEYRINEQQLPLDEYVSKIEKSWDKEIKVDSWLKNWEEKWNNNDGLDWEIKLQSSDNVLKWPKQSTKSIVKEFNDEIEDYKTTRNTNNNWLVTRISDNKTKFVDKNAPISDQLLKWEDKTFYDDFIFHENKSKKANEVWEYWFKQSWLDNVISDLWKKWELDEFNTFLAARHIISLDKQWKSAWNLSLAKAYQVVKDLWKKFEKEWKAWNNANGELLDKITDYGLISKETNKYLKETYPDYIPMHRIMDLVEQFWDIKKNWGIALTKQTVVQALNGWDFIIDKPVNSFLKKVVNTVEQWEKNLATKASVEWLEKQWLAKKVKTFWDDTVWIYENWKKIYYKVPQDIKTVLEWLGYQELWPLTKMITTLTRPFRLAATAINPEFWIKTPRELPSTILQSWIWIKDAWKYLPASTKEVITWWKDLDLLKHHWWVIFEVDMMRNNPELTIDKLIHPLKYKIKNPLRALEDFWWKTDTIYRLIVLKAKRKEYLEQWLSLVEAEKKAINDAVNFMNFTRKWSEMNAMSATIPFLNTHIQSMNALYQQMWTKWIWKWTKKFLWRAIWVLIIPAFAEIQNIASDPKKREIYKDISDYDKDHYLIYISNDAKYDEETKRWEWVYKFPLAPWLNYVSNIARIHAEQYYWLYKHDWNTFNKEILSNVWQFLVPPSENPVIRNTYNLIHNTNDFWNEITKDTVQYWNKRISLDTVQKVLEMWSNYSDAEKAKMKKVLAKFTKDNIPATVDNIAVALNIAPTTLNEVIKWYTSWLSIDVINSIDELLHINWDKKWKTVQTKMWEIYSWANWNQLEYDKFDNVIKQKTTENLQDVNKADVLQRVIDKVKQWDKNMIEFVNQHKDLQKEIINYSNKQKYWNKYVWDKALYQLHWNNRTMEVAKIVKWLKSRQEKIEYIKRLIDRRIISERQAWDVVRLLKKP